MHDYISIQLRSEGAREAFLGLHVYHLRYAKPSPPAPAPALKFALFALHSPNQNNYSTIVRHQVEGVELCNRIML